jgi:hypothetical protein
MCVRHSTPESFHPPKTLYIFSKLDTDRLCKTGQSRGSEDQTKGAKYRQDGSENRRRNYAIIADCPLLPLDYILML